MLFMNNGPSSVEDQDLLKSDQQNHKGGINIKIINDEEFFFGMSEEWNQLAEIAGSPVYVTFDLLSTWWKHYGRHPKRDLFIITVYLDGELTGIAPFYLGKSSLGPLVFHRRLNLMGCGVSDNEFLGFYNDAGYSDFLDIIVHPEYREMVADSIVKFLQENRMKVDVVYFQHVSDNSFVISELLPCLDDRQQPFYLEQTDECPFLTLHDPQDEYVKSSIPGFQGYKPNGNVNSVKNNFKVEEVDSPEMIQKGLEILYDLNRKPWNSRWYSRIQSDDRYFHYLKEISEKAFEKGWLRFKIASDDNGYCAARWVLNFGNRFYDCLSGLAASSLSPKYKPDLELVSYMINEAIELNASKIEFQRGTEPYKFWFTSESCDNWRLRVSLHKGKSILHTFSNSVIHCAAAACHYLHQKWLLLWFYSGKTA